MELLYTVLEIGRNVLVGMNAVIMDNVVIGEESIIGALSFVKEGMQIAPRSLVVGNPAKVIKKVTDEMIEWKTKGTGIYQGLPNDCFDSLKECEPLTEVPETIRDQDHNFKNWKKYKQ